MQRVLQFIDSGRIVGLDRWLAALVD